MEVFIIMFEFSTLLFFCFFLNIYLFILEMPIYRKKEREKGFPSSGNFRLLDLKS